MWTRFMDMNSGGRKKEKWPYIYIEAPLEEAKVIFYNRFGHNPERVTCACCGCDYSIDDYSTIERATAYERNAEVNYDTGEVFETQQTWFCFGKYIPLSEYIAKDDVLLIRASEITEAERAGEVPRQGHIWCD